MATSASPTLIGCSHGTANLDGRATIQAILAQVRELRPELDVREAFVDVQEPAVADVVATALADRAEAKRPCAGAGDTSDTSDTNDTNDTNDTGRNETLEAVVVPLLLSPGFHTQVDIASAVEGHPAQASQTLGPDPRLADLLIERLKEKGVHPGDDVILAAAGSSDPRALDVVEQVRELVADRWPGQITVGYAAVASPSVPDVVARARAAGATRVVVATYLLAPGFFHGRLRDAGADIVTEPLGPDPRLAEIVLNRYDEVASVG